MSQHAGAEIFRMLASHPSARAITFRGETLSYGELDRLTQAYAARLVEQGVQVGDRVAVCMDRSPQLVAALLAAWRVGAAYVPIDPDLPADRITYILEDASARLAIADALGQEKLGRFSGPVVVDPKDGTSPFSAGRSAYLIYTSGSTGRPKGVEIGQTALATFLTSMGERIGPFSTVLAHTSISFDICGLELYLPLLLGQQMILADSDDKRDPMALARLVSRGVDLVQATPTTYRTWVDVDFVPPHEVSLLCGGEPWSMVLKDTLCRWSPKVWNTYGPTEATIWCAVHRVRAEDDAIYLGEPLANTTLHVLDDARRPVRDGEAGELCIGGALLAEGYWQRPALTAEKFFELSPGERVYATGDSVVRTGDKLVFRGRIDDQVKVRGHRVELGEIEVQLCEHVEVSGAAVILEDHRLVAFVRRRPGAVLTHRMLRHHLSQMLPDYMLPNAFHIVDALPLLPSGKIDRNALKTTRV